jgi:hypothetical protein
MTAAWEYRSTHREFVYELHHDGRLVADLWWLYPPAHVSVAMTRIVDRLNLPAAECAPSDEPVWSSVSDERCTGESIPYAEEAFVFHLVEVMVVRWWSRTTRMVEWHQRIVDALNSGRGLPAVEPVQLPRVRPEAAFTGRTAACQ